MSASSAHMVVMAAAKAVLEPIFEADFLPTTFRPFNAHYAGGFLNARS